MGKAAARGRNDLVAAPLGFYGSSNAFEIAGVAKGRLADIEARIRRQPSVSAPLLGVLEQQRLKAIMDVQRIQDELASLPDG